MLSTKERIEIVILMVKLESTAAIRRALQRRGVKVPSANTICDTFQKFKETGSVHNRPKSGRPTLEDKSLKKFQISLKMSLRLLCDLLQKKLVAVIKWFTTLRDKNLICFPIKSK